MRFPRYAYKLIFWAMVEYTRRKLEVKKTVFSNVHWLWLMFCYFCVISNHLSEATPGIGIPIEWKKGRWLVVVWFHLLCQLVVLQIGFVSTYFRAQVARGEKVVGQSVKSTGPFSLFWLEKKKLEIHIFPAFSFHIQKSPILLGFNYSHVPNRRHGSKKFNTAQKGHQFLG